MALYYKMVHSLCAFAYVDVKCFQRAQHLAHSRFLCTYAYAYSHFPHCRKICFQSYELYCGRVTMGYVKSFKLITKITLVSTNLNASYTLKVKWEPHKKRL